MNSHKRRRKLFSDHISLFCCCSWLWEATLELTSITSYRIQDLPGTDGLQIGDLSQAAVVHVHKIELDTHLLTYA